LAAVAQQREQRPELPQGLPGASLQRSGRFPQVPVCVSGPQPVELLVWLFPMQGQQLQVAPALEPRLVPGLQAAADSQAVLVAGAGLFCCILCKDPKR